MSDGSGGSAVACCLLAFADSALSPRGAARDAYPSHVPDKP